jgi:hypothetical protein
MRLDLGGDAQRAEEKYAMGGTNVRVLLKIWAAVSPLGLVGYLFRLAALMTSWEVCKRSRIRG